MNRRTLLASLIASLAMPSIAFADESYHSVGVIIANILKSHMKDTLDADTQYEIKAEVRDILDNDSRIRSNTIAFTNEKDVQRLIVGFWDYKRKYNKFVFDLVADNLDE